MSVLEIERGDDVAVVTMNRPQAYNALSAELRDALRDAFTDLGADESVRAIVLTGTGERAFCAGIDLKELGSDTGVLSFSPGEFNPTAHIAGCPKPVIGAINGVAVTGGWEVALACDILIGSSNARFADTHGRVGLLPSWGLSQLLSRTIGPYRARQLSLTGNFVDSATSQAWGLLSEVVAPDLLLDRARALAADVAGVDPAMTRGLKRLINSGFDLPLGEALAMEVAAARDHNLASTPEAIAARTGKVFERGRSQG